MPDLHGSIRDWWDADAHHYDRSVGHSISDPVEAAAWRAALRRLLPAVPSRKFQRLQSEGHDDVDRMAAVFFLQETHEVRLEIAARERDQVQRFRVELDLGEGARLDLRPQRLVHGDDGGKEGIRAMQRQDVPGGVPPGERSARRDNPEGDP